MDYKSPLNESGEKLFGNNESTTSVLSAPSKFDKSDKKSLDLLLQGSIFTNARNYKQTSISTYLSSPPGKKPRDMKRRKRKSRSSPKNNRKRKGGAGTSTAARESPDGKSPKLTNMTRLRKANPKPESNAREEKKDGGSFNNKYGMHIQSFEDILKEINECNNYRKCLESLPPASINTSLCLPEITDSEPETADSPKNIGKLKRGGASTATRKSPRKDNNSPKLTNMPWLRKANPKRDGEAQEKKKKKLISSSFTKYGMHVQSFEDILKEMRDCTNYKKCLEDLTLIDTSLCLPEVTEDEPESKENLLDCKYMTKEEIKSAFRRHFDYLQEICSGQRYSERHDLYMRSKSCNSSELNYNTSMIVFTGEQKQVLAKLLYKKFGKASLDDHYYFKVLLPEICLKIFMEEHGMSYAEASSYLNQRPVDNA